MWLLRLGLVSSVLRGGLGLLSSLFLISFRFFVLNFFSGFGLIRGLNNLGFDLFVFIDVSSHFCSNLFSLLFSVMNRFLINVGVYLLLKGSSFSIGNGLSFDLELLGSLFLLSKFLSFLFLS